MDLHGVYEGRPVLDDRDGSIFFFYSLVHDDVSLQEVGVCRLVCALAEGCSYMRGGSHYTIITVGPPAVLG